MTWVRVPEGSGFGLENLPYGVFSRPGELRRIGVRIGDHVLDMAGLALDGTLPEASWAARSSLNRYFGEGPEHWAHIRQRIVEFLTDDDYRPLVEPRLVPVADISLHLPVDVADYVDFYASEQHATNLGNILRPNTPPLLPNWKHLPVGYHGRAGTIVASGVDVARPNGQRKIGDFGPSERLDFEAELGFLVGAPSDGPVAVGDFAKHVFGVVLVNDWSARDIQAFEYQPLGPFLGKSFATSISPWVVPLDALGAARIEGPAQDPEPQPYLRTAQPSGLDIQIEIELNGHVVSRPPYSGMYWSPAQMLAHMTVNGAPARSGDLYASGTVSGPEKDQRGSLIELSWNGDEPLELPDGTTRAFLEDGDTVTIRAFAPGANNTTISLGEVTTTITPARP
jgi:fumarylacetoacetase